LTTPSFPTPLEAVSAPTTQWTTVNVGEAFPGVVTPLHYEFALRGGELGIRGAFLELGAFTAEEAEEPAVADKRFMAAFRGRLAVNIDATSTSVGGGSGGGDAVSAILGDDGSGGARERTEPTEPAEPVTDPQALMADRELIIRAAIEERALTLFDRVAALWRENTTPEVIADVAGARARWQLAHGEFREAATVITHVTTMAAGAFGAVTQACTAVGNPDLVARINGGYGDTHDDEMSTALWELAHGSLTMPEFLAEFGYQGHRAADLAATVWREDPSLLAPTVAALATLPDHKAPQVTLVARVQNRVDAERELLDALTGAERDAAARAIEELRLFTILREKVKAISQRSLDIGRAAARTLGADLTERGLLDDDDDVFYLLVEEFITGSAADARARAEYRKALAREYEKTDIPAMFVGNPEPVTSNQAPADGPSTLEGLGASPGVVEGRCRVIVDPATSSPVEPGEIVVCHTTDPSWVGQFLLAAALVIDIGGPLSHGSIVARELGVPCVINTLSGTAQLRTGDIVRVDGSAGTVEVLERSSEHAERDHRDDRAAPTTTSAEARAALPASSWAALHALRLRGRLPARDATDHDTLVEHGYAELSRDQLVLTPDGRAAHATWAVAAPGAPRQAAEAAYEAFGPLDQRLKRASHDWQVMRGGVPNDHTDPAYDAKVVDRLDGISRSVQTLLDTLTSRVPRFDTYAPRFGAALERIGAGDHSWFASPACDSYHTVWMELHEDLLLATGRERSDEEA